jgi:cytochrome c553
MMIRQARGEVARATGHRYLHLEQACEEMSHEALQDLARLIRTLQTTASSEKRKRRRGQFW